MPLKVVKHGLFSCLPLSDKIQDITQHLPSTFAIFSFNFLKIMIYPLPLPILSEL